MRQLLTLAAALLAAAAAAGARGGRPTGRDPRAATDPRAAADPTLRHHRVCVDGRSMVGRHGGHADGSRSVPIVLVHGLAASSAYMTPLARRLARRHAVAVPDLPGFGASDRAPSALDVEQLARALAAWLQACGIDRAVLVANSFGCQVAAALAMQDPSRVAALVLNGPTVDADRRSRAQQLAALLRDIPHEPADLWLVNGWAYMKAGLLHAWQTSHHMLADRIEDRLPRIGCPTLVLRGEHDPISPQRWCERLVTLLPDGELCVLRGAAHATVWDAPQRMADTVDDFLRRKLRCP